MSKILFHLNFVVLIALFSSFSNWTLADIPESAPSRLWQGENYADTVIEYTRRTYPQLPLSIDLNDLLVFNKKGENTTSPDFEKDLHEGVKKVRTQEKEIRNQPSFVDELMSFGFTLLPESVSEILDQLKNGQTIYISASTGLKRSELEEKLKVWILEQPLNSLAPHQIMAKSLELSQGKVLVAWAIAWNVLRDRWEAATVRNYSSITQRLISLTGERNLWKGAAHYTFIDPKEKIYGETTITHPNGSSVENKERRFLRMEITKRGDEFSYLYHRVGVELFAMLMAQYSHSQFIGNLAGTSGAIAEMLKYTKTSGVQLERKKRVTNDILAASSGARIYHLVTRNKKTKMSEQLHLSPSLYLKNENWLYGKKYHLDRNQLAVNKGSKLPPRFTDNTITVEELKFIFRHATHYDSKVLDPIILLSNDSYTPIYQSLLRYLSSRANDQELNQYLMDYFSGVKAKPKTEDVTVDLDLSVDLNLEIMREFDPNIDLEKAESSLKSLVERVLIAKKNQWSLTHSTFTSHRQCFSFYH